MAYHKKSREPRAHWFLLLLGMLVLLGELSFNGFVRHIGAEGSGPQPLPADQSSVLKTHDPVLAVAADGTVSSRGMPARTIALTFDDGPDPRWTPQVLDVLARHHAHATFFVIGSKVDDAPDLTRRIIAEGNEIGSHSFTHAELAALPSWRRRLEMTLTENAIAGATGRRARLLRPPYSSGPDAVDGDDFAVLRDAGAAGYLTVLTDLDTEDWRRPGADAIVRAGTPGAGRGAVVMLHDGGGDRSQTVAGLDLLLTSLEGKGYRFTTVSGGLDLPAAPAAGLSQRLRGTALRAVQSTGEWLATLMTVLLVAALALSLLRLAVQFVTAGIHVRRSRRQARRQRRYLGPVSVIVPAYNEAANIAATVRSLLASDYPKLEVIVVDDGSSDDTAGIVERLRLPGVVVLRQANAGKPAALNAGIAAARADLIVLVDGDTVFEPDAVGALVQHFADPAVGAVSGNTKVANRKGLLGRWQHLEYVIGFNLDRRMFDVGECMPTIPGAIGAFRRETLADVRGVPTDTLAEDTDLTMAILRAGWKVVYEEHAIAWTEAPSSVRQLWRQRYRWCYGTLQAMWKHRRSLRESGPAGRFGRRGLAYLLLFQVLLPLTAPAVDVYAVYGLFFLPLGRMAAVWGAFTALQVLTAAYALRLDRERFGPLWSLPFQQIVYRQLMYLVVVQSTVTALVGSRLRWHRMARTGDAAAVLTGPRR
ncbi:bifunctional polysaccharide deacetylase/glycosyltransferase family 2 protein [Hamadaea tsunoensis]|uniref:bifunctional polysaccharide deacetylase/glycosyltransferase family 2 protein n=1 Tax=Hamadaea tsunoensis TaxID=53368 RepID=UPI0003FD62A4|nr:bifunctional polysaccharide deacetylase/glycosyltransferase family 2 protein [Hamadaea tsunoensis]